MSFKILFHVKGRIFYSNVIPFANECDNLCILWKMLLVCVISMIMCKRFFVRMLRMATSTFDEIYISCKFASYKTLTHLLIILSHIMIET